VTEESASARERLVSAAFALFEQRGYEASSVEDIAAKARVGRTTAFRQFGSKEALIFPDHEALLHDAAHRLSAISGSAIPAEVIAVATMVFEYYLAEGERARQRYRLTRSVPALRDFETATVSRYARLFATHLRRAEPDGWRAELRAELFATAVVAAHNHVLRRWLRGISASPRTELEEALAATWPVWRTSGGRTAVVVMSTDEPVESLVPRLRGLIGEEPRTSAP
jgi:AcrR family transcriptional regulator